MQKKKISCG